MKKILKIFLYFFLFFFLIKICNYNPKIQNKNINYSFKDKGYFDWNKRNQIWSLPILKKEGFQYYYLPAKIEKTDTVFFWEYPEFSDAVSLGETYKNGRINKLLIAKITDTIKVIDTININSNFNGYDLKDIKISKSLKKVMLYYFVSPPLSGQECSTNCYSIIQIYEIKNWKKLTELKYNFQLNFSDFAWSDDETKLVCTDIENDYILVYNALNNQISKIKKIKDGYKAQWFNDESIIYIEKSKKLKKIYLNKTNLEILNTKTIFKTKFQFIMNEKISNFFIINENEILLQMYNENNLLNKYFENYDYILKL